MKIIKFAIIAIIFASISIAVIALSKSGNSSNLVKIGTIAGPETELVEVAKDIAKKKYNIDLEIVQFTNYQEPNAALEDGSIDMNMFQHIPFLNQQIEAHQYKIISAGKTFIYPMAIYSKKYKSLANIKNGAIIAIPNDPTNEGRALLLLQAAGLIKLKEGVTFSAVPKDIISNPHNLNIKEIEAPQLPRTLTDVDYAIITNTFAYSAGLNPKTDVVYTESKDSPYANIIAVKTGQENNEKVLKIIAALHSPEVVEKAKNLFNNSAVPAW